MVIFKLYISNKVFRDTLDSLTDRQFNLCSRNVTRANAPLSPKQNDRSNTLDIADWLHISWPDEFLTWTPAAHDNIAELYESSANIWQPDLALFNSEVVTIESEFCKATNCKIDHTGQVECVPPCQHTAHCASDYRRWPFDTQRCTFSMGTWLQHGAEVNFRLGDTQVEPAAAESQNREWRMREAWYQYQAGRYSANLSFPSVVFGFALERHARTPALMMLTPALGGWLLHRCVCGCGWEQMSSTCV